MKNNVKDSVTVICNGEEEVWENREKAKAFFLKAISFCDGHEKKRYCKIYKELMAGFTVCRDNVD